MFNNASNYEKNLAGAESVIRDVNMAKEMMALNKNSILANVAMVVSVNTKKLQEAALDLLR